MTTFVFLQLINVLFFVYSTSFARSDASKLDPRESPSLPPMTDAQSVTPIHWLRLTIPSSWTLLPTKSWTSSSSTPAICAWSLVVVTWGESEPSSTVNVTLVPSILSTLRMLLVTSLPPGSYFIICFAWSKPAMPVQNTACWSIVAYIQCFIWSQSSHVMLFLHHPIITTVFF